MASTSADIDPDDSFGTSLEQFRRALPSRVARRNMGLELTDERARDIAADPALSESWYKLWRMSASPSAPRVVLADKAASHRSPAAPPDPTARQQELLRKADHRRERNRSKDGELRTYNQLNAAEKAICDAVAATWFARGGIVDVSDMVATFRQAHDSIRALEYYEFTEGVDANAMIEATVSRYNYLVYLKYD
jgi:hypothetical protein